MQEESSGKTYFRWQIVLLFLLYSYYRRPCGLFQDLSLQSRYALGYAPFGNSGTATELKAIESLTLALEPSSVTQSLNLHTSIRSDTNDSLHSLERYRHQFNRAAFARAKG